MKWKMADEIQYMNKFGKNLILGYQTALRMGYWCKVEFNIEWTSFQRKGLHVLVVQWNTGVWPSTVGALLKLYIIIIKLHTI